MIFQFNYCTVMEIGKFEEFSEFQRTISTQLDNKVKTCQPRIYQIPEKTNSIPDQ